MKAFRLFFLMGAVFGTDVVEAAAETAPVVKVGVVTVLSGDFASLGENLRKTTETFQKHLAKRPFQFVFEDSKLSPVDGLNAYTALLSNAGIHLILGGSTSSGTLAAKELLQRKGIPLITPLTGGRSIDSAGEYVLRLGPSDRINGRMQAERFIASGFEKVAVLTEEMEYTEGLTEAFRDRLKGTTTTLVFDQPFVPGNSDFRSLIVSLRRAAPDAVFVSTQTGTAFGQFFRQLKQLWPNAPEIHTNFVVAANGEAKTAAGGSLGGVKYLSPALDQNRDEWKYFLKLFIEDHGHPPTIPFHAAGAVDALRLAERFLESGGRLPGPDFGRFLHEKLGTYPGLMGNLTFDSDGNSSIGFVEAVISGS